MDRFTKSFADEKLPSVIPKNDYPVTQDGVKFNTAASGSCCYTSAGSATFTVPAGVYNISTEVIGGGAGAISCLQTGNDYYSMPFLMGNAGHTVYRDRIPVTPGNTISVVVGSGGVGCCNHAQGTSGTVTINGGGTSCFYNADFQMVASGGYGPNICWTTCNIISSMGNNFCEAWKVRSGQGAITSSGGLVLWGSTMPTLGNLDIFCRCSSSTVMGYKSYRGMLAMAEQTSCCFQLPTLGSSGISGIAGPNMGCARNGADGAVIICWHKGQ
jgi:hypothetical protein